MASHPHAGASVEGDRIGGVAGGHIYIYNIYNIFNISYKYNTYIYIYIHMYDWCKPGNKHAPQKQDENRGFGPGQAAGRTPGKLGGNMPVKLAKMRGKKRQQTE